jgi:mono/diheme cytochrome c family protein
MCRFRCVPSAGSQLCPAGRFAWMAIVIAVIVSGDTGCVQQMADQPRYKPLAASSVFPNGASSRTPVPGTVARGELQLDDAFFTGKSSGQLVTDLPSRALQGRTMAELLSRGQERFNIFCSQCHGEVGGGSGGSAEMRENVGMVVRRGFPMPPTYHQPRLRDAPIGHFFDVITNGLGRMPAHGYLVPPEDRWAIAAYIRALQFSQHAEGSELDAVDLARLNDERPAQQD